MEEARDSKFWKPIIDAPPSMRMRAEKLERKEGRTPRRVGGSGKLTAVEPKGEAQISCWVYGGDLRKMLRECPRGRGMMTRYGDKILVRKNRQGRRGW